MGLSDLVISVSQSRTNTPEMFAFVPRCGGESHERCTPALTQPGGKNRGLRRQHGGSGGETGSDIIMPSHS